ncbi:MAG: cyclase [Anaerolineae bacterium]|nr:cyclase [Anaerolineae bacterium]
MDHYQSFRHLLQNEIGQNIITSSAYDTAWVARLGEVDEDLASGALEWLRDNQLPDGGWGACQPTYYHDRLICTLSAMTALARYGRAEDRSRWQRAQLALEIASKGLLADPAGATVGFEMIVPTLMAEADALGVIKLPQNGFLDQLSRYRAAKLAALPEGMINRRVTVAFSAEMVGLDGLHLLDADNLQEANGSVACNPAATAFFARHVRPQDPAALAYLRRFTVDGSVPYVAPIDVFEFAWPLWNLALTGLADDGEWSDLSRPYLDFLGEHWAPNRGIASVADFSVIDGDATSVTYEVLSSYGRAVDLGGVLAHENGDHFRCYALEANPSISTNVHALGALRQAGLDIAHPSVQKILGFLRRSQTLQLFWADKWHASPYYPTAHAIIACAGYADELIEEALYWTLETQNADGSWGYYLPTAEETAYCLQALVVARRHGHAAPDRALIRGAAWLAEHAEPPYPPLWIGKCLYYPSLVVRSAILSALILAEQEQS